MAKGISVNIRLKPNLLDKTRAEADRLGLSYSAFVTLCLASYIDGVKFERNRVGEEVAKAIVRPEPSKVKYRGRKN